jgi:hypothetical protein
MDWRSSEEGINSEAFTERQVGPPPFSTSKSITFIIIMNFIAASYILSAIIHKKVEEDTPCVPEYTKVLKCMRSKGNGVCFSCILDSIARLNENTTVKEIVDSSLCVDLHTCATEKCDPGCNSEWNTLYTCSEKWSAENAEDVDICPGLGKVASSAKPIVVQDFFLPFNYTNAGLEKTQSF